MSIQKVLEQVKSLDSFYNYLDTLSLLEESALLHIIFFLIIILNLFSIVGILLGNEIIIYFNLEKRFPKLAILLKYRAKFQKYYLIWNLLGLFLVCFVGLYLNILVLLLAK